MAEHLPGAVIQRDFAWGLQCQAPIRHPIGNFAWVGACLVLLFGGAVSPTPLGQAYLVVQAVAVVVLAELQWMALRRLRPAAVA